MSFITSVLGNTWTHSTSGKGGRRELVKKGVWVIDHRPTGRFIIGSSNDVSSEVDQQLKLLAKGKHPIRLLQALYQKPDDDRGNPPPMVITEYPLSSLNQIRQTLKEIRETNTTPYCLLN